MGASWEQFRGQWRISITQSGERKYKTPKNQDALKSAKEREKILRGILSEQDRGVALLDLSILAGERQTRVDSSSLTLNEEFEEYIARSRKLAPGSVKAKRIWWKGYVAGVIGDKIPRQVTADDIRLVLRKARAKGRTEYASLNSILATVSAVFSKHLVPSGKAQFNPAAGLDEECGQKKAPRDNHFTHAQEDLLLEAVRKCDYRDYVLVLLGLKAGLRIGEAGALLISDIDLERNQIQVVRNRNCHGDIGKTKTKSSTRIVPIISEELKTALRFWIKELAETRPGCEVLFPGRFAAGTMDPGAWEDNFFHPLLRSLGIPAGRKDPKGKTFHDLRHSFATDLHEATGKVRAVSLALGHSNTKITEDIYIHMKAVDLGGKVSLDRGIPG